MASGCGRPRCVNGYSGDGLDRHRHSQVGIARIQEWTASRYVQNRGHTGDLAVTSVMASAEEKLTISRSADAGASDRV